MALRFMWECEDNIFIAEDTFNGELFNVLQKAHANDKLPEVLRKTAEQLGVFKGSGQPDNTFDCLSLDLRTGKTHRFKATMKQVTAIFALGFGGVAEEKDRAYNASVLYDDARTAIGDCPPECSPIP